jgi:hypothetical protein
MHTINLRLCAPVDVVWLQRIGYHYIRVAVNIASEAGTYRPLPVPFAVLWRPPFHEPTRACAFARGQGQPFRVWLRWCRINRVENLRYILRTLSGTRANPYSTIARYMSHAFNKGNAPPTTHSSNATVQRRGNQFLISARSVALIELRYHFYCLSRARG